MSTHTSSTFIAKTFTSMRGKAIAVTVLGRAFGEMVMPITGIILIAKKRKALVEIHRQMRKRSIHKKYQVMVNGRWEKKQLIVDLNLLKSSSSDGSKKVRVLPKHQNEHGSKDSRSVFFLRKTFADLSMLDVKLVTGRTHQIRVHLSHLGFPIVGDDKYGNFSLNKYQKKIGFKRMFLHASELGFVHPLT